VLENVSFESIVDVIPFPEVDDAIDYGVQMLEKTKNAAGNYVDDKPKVRDDVLASAPKNDPLGGGTPHLESYNMGAATTAPALPAEAHQTKYDKQFYKKWEKDVIEMCYNKEKKALKKDEEIDSGATYKDTTFEVINQNDGKLGSLDHPTMIGRIEGLQFYSNVTPKV